MNKTPAEVWPDDVHAVAIRVTCLPGYPDFAPAAPAYAHMGALLVDAGLEAGIDYVAVVQPRVRMLLEAWPEAAITDLLLSSIESEGLHDVLRWPHPEKPGRVERLVRLLQSEGVQSVDDLGEWIMQPGSRDKLLSLRGIRDKTADYLANLAGQPVAAVDRHIRTFVADAGVDVDRYREVHALLGAVAEELHLNLGSLDREIWRFVSGGDQGGPSLMPLRRDNALPAAVVAAEAPITVEEQAETTARELAQARAERDQARAELRRLRARLQAAIEDR